MALSRPTTMKPRQEWAEKDPVPGDHLEGDAIRDSNRCLNKGSLSATDSQQVTRRSTDKQIDTPNAYFGIRAGSGTNCKREESTPNYP